MLFYNFHAFESLDIDGIGWTKWNEDLIMQRNFKMLKNVGKKPTVR